MIGTAIALNLLFGIPLAWGVFITALDVLLVLFLQNKGFRLLEALVIALVVVVGLCFLFEIVVSRPDARGVALRLPAVARHHPPIRRCSTSPSASSALR